MTPVAADGRWYNPAYSDASKGVASQTATTSGVSTAVNADDTDSIEATVAVTAVSGTTPTLVVTLETTLDGVNWYTVDTIPPTGNISTVSSYGKVVGAGNLGSQIRWRWTIAGTTPSFTFSITTATRRGRG